jgi:hypothetical protein
MNTSHAIFGGLALIAGAILFANPRFVGAQDDNPAPQPGRYQLMTSFQGVQDISARQVVFRIDSQSGTVSACAWSMSAKDAPICSTWSKKDSAIP